MKTRRRLPTEGQPKTRTIESTDKVEKISFGALKNGVVLLTLLQRRNDGRYVPIKCWRRDLPVEDLMNKVSQKARLFLEQRAQQRAKETKLKQR